MGEPFDEITDCCHWPADARRAQARIDALEAENTQLMLDLESLTPGGSEFHNDPERCVKWVRERLSGVVEQVKKRKAAETEVERLREALLGLLPSFAAEEWDADCGCPQCNAYQVARAALESAPSPEEWWAAYHTKECTCRQVPVEGRIFIGGQDDCPVHGFGTDTDPVSASS